MAREPERRLKRILSKVSPQDLIGAELQESKLIYSVIGFLPASDMVDNAMLISNTAYLLAEKGFHVCVVDLNVFYPKLYHFLDVEPQRRGEGLIKALKSDKIDLRDVIQKTQYDRLYLLSPSPQDLLEEYFDFEIEHLERVVAELKDMFDLVLLDIPNNPPLEFCLGAMKLCHVGFFTASERIEAVGNMLKLLEFARSVGISTAKFTSVILMNLQEIDFDYKVFQQSGFQLAAAFPLVKGAFARALEGRLYVKDNPIVNKYFLREITRLVTLLSDS